VLIFNYKTPFSVGSTLVLAHPLYYKRLVQLASIIFGTIKDPPRLFVPKVPYPERLQAPKKGGKFEDILEVFKKVQINISFLDAI
jgi:hypothetical protein